MTTLYQRSWPQMNETPDSLLATDEPPPFTVDNENGTSPLLIVADHAGKHFPRRLAQLGLSNTECERHIALDIGVVVSSREIEMAFQAEFGAGGCRLPAVVGLHPRSPDNHVGALSQGIGEEKLIVPRLIAAEKQSGTIIALDKDAHAAQTLRKARHFFQRGRQMGQVYTRQSRRLHASSWTRS